MAINMEYQKLFVRCTREDNMVYVTNDRNYVDSYWTETQNEEEFNTECEKYLNSERFQEKLKQQRGY